SFWLPSQQRSPYFSRSIEKLSNHTEPKIGHGGAQFFLCRLSTTALVAGPVANSQLNTCQSLLPSGSEADCPRRLCSPAASLTIASGRPPVTMSCVRASKLIP